MKTGYESGIGAWYDKLPFKQACGRGSYPTYNTEYCKQLLTTLGELDVKRVVDFGCGSLESYNGLIDWTETDFDFVGYDANIQCVQELKKQYPDLEFHQSTLGEIPDEGDAIIIKDVMIHWYDEAITNFFNEVFSKYRYVIYMHSTTEKGYPVRDKREVYNLLNPKDRQFIYLDRTPIPDGYYFWPEPNGCYGYKDVPVGLLPNDKIIKEKNIQGDSMKTYIVFDGNK